MTTVRHPDRRAEILDAARAAFAEHGYDRASITDIATRVGVVEGAIYKHFASKRDLLHQVIQTFYEPLVESARAGAAVIDSPRDRLRFLVWRQLTALTEEPLLCRLIISEARPHDDYASSEVGALSRAYTALAVEALEDGIARGEIRGDLPLTMVRDLIYGGTEHIAWRALTGRGQLDPARVADDLTSLLFDGLSTRADDSGGAGSGPADLARLTSQVDRLEDLVARLGAARRRTEGHHPTANQVDPRAAHRDPSDGRTPQTP